MRREYGEEYRTNYAPSLTLMTVIPILYTINSGTAPRYEYCMSDD